MDKLKAMQAFVQIADSGSLTAAAHVLNSSLPAMVRTLAALESQLGVRLLNRTTRRIALTAEGRSYLERSRAILAAVADAESAVSNDAEEPSGELTITAPVLFGTMYVMPAINRFLRHHDKVRCNVRLLDRVVNLHEEGIDVGIRIGELADSTLVAQQLGSIRRVVVASPAYLRRHGTPKHPHDLQQHNCVRFVGSSGSWWQFQENGKAVNVSTKGNLDVNHASAAVAACLDDIGIGAFISYQVAPHVANKKLKIILEPFETAPRPINIVYPHARLLPARTRAFIDWLKADWLKADWLKANPLPHTTNKGKS
jgi:DNA-binding transcriptional LysR family regulator